MTLGRHQHTTARPSLIVTGPVAAGKTTALLHVGLGGGNGCGGWSERRLIPPLVRPGRLYGWVRSTLSGGRLRAPCVVQDLVGQAVVHCRGQGVAHALDHDQAGTGDGVGGGFGVRGWEHRVVRAV